MAVLVTKHEHRQILLQLELRKTSKKCLLKTFVCFISTVMSIPQIYFGRQELGLRADLDDDTLRYWIRAGILRAEHGGGGKGRHHRFTRLELGLAVVMARLRLLGISSTALGVLSEQFHAAVDWMRDRRLDPQQVTEVHELVSARSQFEETPGNDANAAWQDFLKRKTSDDWFDLPPSAIRLAERVSIEEWKQHHSFFQILADVALTRPAGTGRFVRLARDDSGRWRVTGTDETVDSVELRIDAMAAQLWSDEQ